MTVPLYQYIILSAQQSVSLANYLMAKQCFKYEFGDVK